MNTMTAMMMGKANRGRERMVFDWDKAAEIIKERKPKYASAGLKSDWENTGGMIYSNGEPVTDEYTFLASTWATPELDVDGDIIPCFKMKHEVPDWGSHTKWPQSSMRILNGT